MLKLNSTLQPNDGSSDIQNEFWPVQAEELLTQKEYAKAVELCEQKLSGESQLLSGKLIFAKALLGLNRDDDAIEQLYQILSIDPDHISALKLLADIYYKKSDQVSAMANYNRILEIDSACAGLKCEFTFKPTETSPTITLVRGPETAPEIAPETASEIVETPVSAELTEIEPATETPPAIEEVTYSEPVNRNPFRTETVADLYLNQGQPRLAAEIFKELINGSHNDRLTEKLKAAEKQIAQKERRDVEQ